MFCPTCGSDIQDGLNACPNCGAIVGGAAPAQPVYQQPVYQQPAYQQPVYQAPANADLGASKGNTAMILGILSLFLGPIFAIISLVLAGQSKQYTGGVRNHDAQVGFVCSWISLGCYIAFIAIYIFIIMIAVLEEMCITAPLLAMASLLLI